jgi:hypothetical protein
MSNILNRKLFSSHSEEYIIHIAKKNDVDLINPFFVSFINVTYEFNIEFLLFAHMVVVKERVIFFCQYINSRRKDRNHNNKNQKCTNMQRFCTV